MGVLASGHQRLGPYDFEWAFTDRTDGLSTGAYAEANLGLHVGDDAQVVQDNRHRAAQQMRVSADRWVTMVQVHGSTVARIKTPPPSAPEADALVCGEPEIALVTQVADCVPILIATSSGDIAAIHAGWRGVVCGVVDATMSELIGGADSGHMIRAWVGPAICGGCYEVGEQVRADICAHASDAWAVTREGTAAADVRAGVVQQLRAWNVGCEVVGGCTFENPDLYSYRREHRTGRQAGMIVRRADASNQRHMGDHS